MLSIFSRPSWDPSGRHCYITGGSTGLGLALAILLTKRGADVSIVARNEENLKNALAKLEAARVNPNQILKSYSFALNTQTAATEALEAACLPHAGQSPDAVFLCAGKATPGFFIEQTEESMRDGMDNTYWLAAWSAMAASKRMIRTRTKGKIVFVSSCLNIGLAETLRQELLLYSIDIQIYMPVTMFTPGYEEENKTKPNWFLSLTPEKAAKDCVRKGDFHITDTFIADVFRSKPVVPLPLGQTSSRIFIALTLWRRDVDKQVVGHREAHSRYLDSKKILEAE
ncbi:oxidoreductase [Lactarius quietus]|nr:oxidoreductase [Lactarius quietus]